MTIDQSQTPLGEDETQKPTQDVERASDTPTAAENAADTTMPGSEAIPESGPANEEPTPAAEAIEADAPVDVEPEILPGSDPVEPDPPAEPADPTPPPAPAPEPPAPDPAAPPQPRGSESPDAEPVAASGGQSDADLFEAAMRSLESGDDQDSVEGSFKKLSRGDRVEATIIQVDRDKVFVDLGTKSEGIVPLGELSEDNLETAKGHFNVGDKINVVVLRPESAEGNPIVSKKRADFEEVWDKVERAHRSGEMITAQVVDRVKGGLVVDVGVRGFVPATHVGSGKLRNIEKFVGQPLQLKVIEIDRDRKKVVLSNREAEEQRRVRAKEEIFETVKPGDRLSGTVRRLTDYGAFVDLGGVDGLLHISEMSWARINHPKEMFKEGQDIEVMVLRLDPSAGKISLGHRQVLPDPWNLIKQNYTVGQKLNVNISRIVQSGAFIRLPEGAEAFMPVSEMSFRRIKRPQDVVEEGQEVEAQIIDLRTEERRMVLSMRALGGGGELRPGADRGGAPSTGFEEDRGRLKDKKKGKRGRARDDFEDFEETVGRRGFATGGATIGERLGMLKGFLGREDEEDGENESEDKVEAPEAPEEATETTE